MFGVQERNAQRDAGKEDSEVSLPDLEFCPVLSLYNL